MADGVKTYEIVINGLTQSIAQVDALNKKLEQLEKRMNSLPNGSVGGSGGSSKSELKEEEKLMQEIDKLNSKILATRTEEYKVTQKQKEELKLAKKEVEETLAKERLLSKQYDNTIKGWKQELKDIKSVMQSMNPDDAGFTELTQRADELNTKLKNVEQSYGQFGRNVGNYQGDIEKAFSGVSFMVGDVEMQFKNLSKAKKEISSMMDSLRNKQKEETQEYKDLAKALEEVNKQYNISKSARQDAARSSSFMDSSLDMAQSITSIAQMSKGFGSVFGIDNGEVDKSIQQLVGLQTALMGLEKIRQQLITNEGLGKYINKLTGSFDGLTTSVKRYNISFDTVLTSSREQKVVFGELSRGVKAFGANLAELGEIAATAFVVFEAFEQAPKWWFGAGQTVQKNADEIDKALSGTSQVTMGLEANVDALTDSYQGLYKETLAVASGNRESEFSFEGLREQIDLINTGNQELAQAMKKGLSDSNNAAKSTIEINGKLVTSYKEAAKAAEELFYKKDTREGAKEYAKAVGYGLSDFLQKYKNALDETSHSLEKQQRVIKHFTDELNDPNNKLLKGALNHPEQWINDEKSVEKINKIRNAVIGLANSIKSINTINVYEDAEAFLKSLMSEEEILERRIKRWEDAKSRASDMSERASYTKAIEKARERIANLGKNSGGGSSSISSAEKSEVDIEKEIQAFKISLMEEGKEKELAVLEEARKAKVEEAKKLGQDVNAVTEFYAKEKEKIEKKYADIEKQRKKNNLKEISQLTTQLLQLDLETANTTEEKIAAVNRIEEDNARNINAYYDERIAETQALIGADEEENKKLRERIRLYEELRSKSLLKNYNDAQKKRADIDPENFGDGAEGDDDWKRIEKIIGVVNYYLQAVGSALQSYLSSFYSYEDSLYQAMIASIDKDIDKAREKYEALSDLAKEHADNVNSIESELSNARGDRRQALIDQLNAEMAAQRAKVEEERQAQEEMKKLEAKKEQEEIKQRKKEQKRAETQAIISGALAIANGFATVPFKPTGIAMGALATVLTMAQINMIRKQKFADGGLLEGKSHAQGGIPVGNTNIEVEGGEYVTNKHTTEKNLDVLTFINSKRKKLDIGDFIDFYSSGKAGRNLNSAMPKTRFADGGSIPTLRSDIDLGTRLYDTLDAYANRPVYVSVVDINRKQADVRNVKVLAGLEA